MNIYLDKSEHWSSAVKSRTGADDGPEAFSKVDGSIRLVFFFPNRRFPSTKLVKKKIFFTLRQEH